MPDDLTPPPPPLPPQPPQQQAPRPVIPVEEPAGEVSAGEPVMPVSEPGVVAPAPFAQVYSAPPPPPGHYPPAYPPPLESTGRAQEATAYPPPAQYPPPATYPPPAAYPPPPPAQYPPGGGYSAAQAPWPTAPVDYRGAGYGGPYSRPAFVTTLAVFSIVTAALSLLASAFTGCTSAIVLSGAQRGSVVVPGPPRATATVTPPPVAAPSPNGLGPGDVGVVSNVLRSKTARAMSPERRRQLEAFLGEQGKLVFESPDGIITSRKVFDTLGAVGQEFARAGQTGADYFQIKESPISKLPGRLRVFDDRAVFEPDDHGTTLRSAAAKPSQDEVTEAVPVDPGLTEDGATAVINQVRTYSRNLLNAAQENTLRSTLQSPAYSAWVAPSSTVPGLTAQVKSVVVRPDRSVTIQFVMAAVTLDAQGNVVGGPPGVPGGGGAAAGGTNPATMPAGAGSVTLGAISVSKASCGTALAEAAISGLLAIFLLVVAILSLRQSPGAGRLYLIYAVAKLVSGIVAVVAFAGIINSLSAGTDTSGYAQSMVTAFGGMARVALGVTVVGLVLPVVILLTMTLNRTVRAYFRTA